VSDNFINVESRDRNGIAIRTKPNPCDLSVDVERNKIVGAWTGISVLPGSKNTDEAADCVAKPGGPLCMSWLLYHHLPHLLLAKRVPPLQHH
jgi:hypothetical protein